MSRTVGAPLLAALLSSLSWWAIALHAEPETGPPAVPTLESLMEGMARTSGVRAQFREVKELALLSAPLESRGTLYFVPPDRLGRITTEPSASKLVIDGKRFRFHDVAGGDEVDLSASPIAREYVGSFIVLFNGDLQALRRLYEPYFQAGADGWSLELRPRRRPLRDVVERVTLAGKGRALTRMELLETGGDRTTTWFDAVQTDYRFSDEELRRVFSDAGAPEEAP